MNDHIGPKIQRCLQIRGCKSVVHHQKQVVLFGDFGHFFNVGNLEHRVGGGFNPEQLCRAGEDFHDRFVLTELGGIMIGAGLSADGPTESATFTLLDFEHAQGLRSRFADGSPAYARAGYAVRICDDGSTELF